MALVASASDLRYSSSATQVRITTNESALEEVRAHLMRCDSHFLPALSERVDIPAYAAKIRANALTIEAWDGSELIGLAAAYIDTINASCFLTSISVLPDLGGRGIATALLEALVSQLRCLNVESVTLEVSKRSATALALYRKLRFKQVGERGTLAVMQLRYKCGELPRGA